MYGYRLSGEYNIYRYKCGTNKKQQSSKVFIYSAEEVVSSGNRERNWEILTRGVQLGALVIRRRLATGHLGSPP